MNGTEDQTTSSPQVATCSSFLMLAASSVLENTSSALERLLLLWKSLSRYRFRTIIVYNNSARSRTRSTSQVESKVNGPRRRPEQLACNEVLYVDSVRASDRMGSAHSCPNRSADLSWHPHNARG